VVHIVPSTCLSIPYCQSDSQFEETSLSLSLWQTIMLFCCTAECTWTEKQRQLATLAFDRWKFYQYTSLRVGTNLRFVIDYDSIKVEICCLTVVQSISQSVSLSTPPQHRSRKYPLRVRATKRPCLQTGWPQTWKLWNTQGFL